jgi:hypothetical protein
MNTSGLRHDTPDGRRTSGSSSRVASAGVHRGGAGCGHPAVRPGRLAGGVAAVVCLVAVASACSSTASAPGRQVAHSRPPAAAPATPAPPAPAPASAVPASAAPAGVPRCLEGSLATTVSGYQVGGGQDGITVKLTNTGTASCSLYGYPGLGLEDGRHRVLPSQTHWGSTYFARDPGPSLIILSPGQSATSSIAFAGGGPGKRWAYFLQVTPPNAYDHAVIPLSYGTGGGGNDIHATAMARHTTIYRGSPGGCGCNP